MIRALTSKQLQKVEAAIRSCGFRGGVEPIWFRARSAMSPPTFQDLDVIREGRRVEGPVPYIFAVSDYIDDIRWCSASDVIICSPLECLAGEAE